MRIFNNQGLGPYFREKRIEREIKQVDMAKQLGCSAQFVYNFEVGKSPVPMSTLKTMAKCYGIESSEVIHRLLVLQKKNLEKFFGK